ncbi:hypothetical protein ACH4UM_29555 [Streptomyces sp. NPDC020801]|uniref:hypothetical protein n=1 Tax=unclassified Streptomyces TaxID=2593676 RepID=UPI0037BBBA25
MARTWLNQFESWFGIITAVDPLHRIFECSRLIKRIRDQIDSWNTNARPFTWTATAGEILAKVRLVATSLMKRINNNAN